MDDRKFVLEKVAPAFAVQQVSEVVVPWIEAAGLCLHYHEVESLNGAKKLALGVLELWNQRLKVS